MLLLVVCIARSWTVAGANFAQRLVVVDVAVASLLEQWDRPRHAAVTEPAVGPCEELRHRVVTFSKVGDERGCRSL